MLFGYWTTGIVGMCSLKETKKKKEKIPEISFWLAGTFCTVLQRGCKAKPSSISELMNMQPCKLPSLHEVLNKS